MSRGLLTALAFALLAASASAVVLLTRAKPPVQRPADIADPPALALLTSLPLLFGDEFSLEGTGSPTLDRLQARYRVVPVAIADEKSLRGHHLLLMAHPRAQPAEVLVELDAWVRRGGRVVLLADPKLDWHSERPLGDRLRPPPDFADTGLLAHWGLRLAGPVVDGPRTAKVRELNVQTASHGVLESMNSQCAVEEGGLVATCQVGRGKAIVIADADFLNVEGPGALDGPTDDNLRFLIAELSRVVSR